jgi:glutamate-1-semialdehyde aminotransferase
VLVCGYHGWQDWFIGSTTRNKGVPEAVSGLTETFKYNDLDSLRKIVDARTDIACVVMEPMNSIYPEPGFLEGVREITKTHGIVLVFDETITGFRFSEGGAQELFNVIPDLSTFGKGIANGYPLSVITGKREIMMEMEEIFFSGTFGGELLSLAAAKKVLGLHLEKKVTPTLTATGLSLNQKISQLIEEKNLSYVLQLSGHPSWIFLNWNSVSNIDVNLIKTLFMQEMFQNGILVVGTHNINLRHTDRYLEKVVRAYEDVLQKIEIAIESNNFDAKLRVPPLTPLFKVR